MTRARCTLLAASLALACTPSTWDVARLEASHRALAAIASHRLGDVTPYLLPRQGRLVLFLCRWPSDAPIAVSLPPTASEQERGDLRRVLRAMEAAGLGVRFEVSTAKPAGIAIRFAEVEAGTRAPIRAADTVADCGLARTLPDASVRVLPARIVHASIVLERGAPRMTVPGAHAPPAAMAVPITVPMTDATPETILQRLGGETAVRR